MSKDRSPDTGHLQQLNALLEAGLALPEGERDAWLRALPAAQRAVVPALRALLLRATEETDHFMRRSVARLRLPTDPAETVGAAAEPVPAADAAPAADA